MCAWRRDRRSTGSHWGCSRCSRRCSCSARRRRWRPQRRCWSSPAPQETPNASSGDIASAIQSLGTTGQYTADVTSNAADINAAKLADYRAVVFVHSSGNVLDAGAGDGADGLRQQRRRLRRHRRDRAARAGRRRVLQHAARPRAPRASRAPRRRATRTSSSWTACTRPRARCRRSGRAPRPGTPGPTNPTGTVHTVARVRMAPGIAGPGRHAAHQRRDAPRASAPAQNAVQPQGNRAASWCRDVQQGRSFYTELGSSSASVAEANIRKHLIGAIQWAGRPRPRRLQGHDHLQLHVDADHAAQNPNTRRPNQYYGELTKSALADDGRLFYGGRAICFQRLRADHQLGLRQHRPRLRHGPPLGSARPGHQQPEPGEDQLRRQPLGLGRPRQHAGVRAELHVGGGPGRHGARPRLHQGPPVHLHPVLPVLGRRAGQGHRAQARHRLRRAQPGVGRMTYKGEKRLSRFTYDEATKSFVPGSEKVIFSYTSPVYNCCHNGAGHGLRLQGQPLRHQRRQRRRTARSPTAPTTSPTSTTAGTPTRTRTSRSRAPAWAPRRTAARSPAADRPADTGPSDQLRRRARDVGQHERLRGQDHPHQAARRPGRHAGRRLDVHDPGRRRPERRRTCSRRTASRSWTARPSPRSSRWACAARTRSTSTRRPTRSPPRGSVRTRPTRTTTWGPAKTENATMMNSAGNWGWPFCQAGNRWGYRVKAPEPRRRRRGGLPGDAASPGRSAAAPNGKTGALLRLPRRGPQRLAVQHRPAGRSRRRSRSTSGTARRAAATATDQRQRRRPLSRPATATTCAAPAIYRLCPWLGSSGSQAPIDGGIYRKPAGDKPDAWPSYWDGRWFLIDFAGATNIRHALLMDPATQFKGGQPDAVDSLLGIIPTTLLGGTRPVFMDFGADGALYVGSYAGSYYAVNNANMGVWRFAYTGGGGHPGPGPEGDRADGRQRGAVHHRQVRRRLLRVGLRRRLRRR